MQQKLAGESENNCLKMNKSKTKLVLEDDTPIPIGRVQDGLHLADDRRCGNSMLRPWLNHGTLRVHNDDDVEDTHCCYTYAANSATGHVTRELNVR